MKPRREWNHGLRLPWHRNGAKRGCEASIYTIVFTQDGTRLWLTVTPTRVHVRVMPQGGRRSDIAEQRLRWQSVAGKLPLSRGAAMVEQMLLGLGATDLYEAWDMDARRPMVRIETDSLTSPAAASTLRP